MRNDASLNVVDAGGLTIGGVAALGAVGLDGLPHAVVPPSTRTATTAARPTRREDIDVNAVKRGVTTIGRLQTARAFSARLPFAG